MSEKKDILDKMSKEELVFWVRQNIWSGRPTRRDMLYIRWTLGHKKQMEKDEALPSLAEAFPVAEWNGLVDAFNAAKSSDEKMKIATKLSDMERRKEEYFRVHEKSRAAWKRLDRLYAQMQKERK